MFSPSDLNKVVQDTMALTAAIPPNHKGAFLVVVDQDEVKAVVAERINDTWTVTGYVDHQWVGGVSAGATLQATW